MRAGLAWLARQPEGRWLLILSALALGARLGWAVAAAGRAPRFDEVGYLDQAARLCEGVGYVDAAGRPSSFWPPLYPAALAAVTCGHGASDPAVVGLQVLVGLATCVIVSRLGARVAGLAAGRLAGAIVALYPTHAMYATLRLTEPLATLLLVAAAAVVVLDEARRPARAALAGVLLGAAALTRPALAPLALFAPWWYAGVGATRMRRWASAGALVAGVALIAAPWAARNARATGRWTLSSSGAFNFLIGNHPGALGGTARPLEFNRDYRTEEGMEAPRGWALGWAAIAADPAAAAVRTVYKLSYFVALETDGVLWNVKGFARPPPIALTAVLLAAANAAYLLLGAGFVLALAGPPRHRRLVAFTVSLAFTLAGLSVVFAGDPRYHFPLVPFAAILAAAFAADDAPAWRAGLGTGERAAWRRLRRAAIAGAVLAALAAGNLWLKAEEARRFGPPPDPPPAARPAGGR